MPLFPGRLPLVTRAYSRSAHPTKSLELQPVRNSPEIREARAQDFMQSSRVNLVAKLPQLLLIARHQSRDDFRRLDRPDVKAERQATRFESRMHLLDVVGGQQEADMIALLDQSPEARLRIHRQILALVDEAHLHRAEQSTSKRRTSRYSCARARCRFPLSR